MSTREIWKASSKRKGYMNNVTDLGWYMWCCAVGANLLHV